MASNSLALSLTIRARESEKRGVSPFSLSHALIVKFKAKEIIRQWALTFIRILCLKIEMVRLAYFNALRCLNQFREETIAFTL